VAATREDAYYTLSSTCPHLTGGGDNPGEPGSSSMATPGAMAIEDPGAGTVLPRVVHQGAPGPAPHTTKSQHRPPSSSPNRGSAPSIPTLSMPRGASSVPPAPVALAPLVPPPLTPPASVGTGALSSAVKSLEGPW
jgi:hypothetical protein